MYLNRYNKLSVSGGYSISGRIFQDVDGSGYYNQGDIELGGMLIHYSNGIISRSVVSCSDGFYHIPYLSEGTWFLSLPQTSTGLVFSYASVEWQQLEVNNRIKVELTGATPHVGSINIGYRGDCQLSGQIIARKTGSDLQMLGIRDINLVIMPVDQSFAPRKVLTDHVGYYQVDHLLPYEYRIFLGKGHPLPMANDLIEIEIVNLQRNTQLKTMIDFSSAISISSAVGDN